MEPIIIEIVLKTGLIRPDQLPELLRVVEATVQAGGVEPVILSGRLPVWAFCALTHIYHPRPWTGTFEPRLGAAIVVQRHVPEAPPVGAVVPLTGEEQKIVIEF